MKKIFLALAAISLFLVFSAPAGAQDKAVQYYQAGNNLYLQKKYDDAIRYYEAAVDNNPRFWEAFQGLGNCYYGKGDNPKALSNYQRCLSLHPDNPALSSFTASMRAESDKAAAKPVATYTAEEQAKIERVTLGQKEEHFELAPAGGIANEQYLGMGFGAGLGGYLMFDPGFGVGGMTHLYIFSKYGFSVEAFELMPAVKLRLAGNVVRPYLVGGAGLSLLKADYAGGFYPMVDLGGGLEISLQPDTSLFLEARVDTAFNSNSSGSYIPIEAGLVFTL